MPNDDRTRISAVVPVYNAEGFLPQCLESIRIQTLQEIEVIIVNDGSSDSSQAICEKFLRRDGRFRLINQKNAGLASARRAGMLAARGEYIGFVDSDDWCEPNMYERLYDVARENESDIVFFNCYRNDQKKQWQNSQYLRCGAYNRQQILAEILPRTLAHLDSRGNNRVIRWANWLRIFRRSMIERHQIYNDPRFRRCQDLQLTFEATLHARSYYYLGDEYLYHNRIVPQSLSRGYTIGLWGSLRLLIERLYEDVHEFTELDLRSQMDCCAFFFAVLASQNESKTLDSVAEDDRRARLQELCHDPLCQRFLRGVPFERLSRVNRAYYQGLRKKSVEKLLRANELADRQARKTQIMSLLLSYPFIRGIYLKLRRARRRSADLGRISARPSKNRAS